MHDLVTELYPVCRSITGNGIRETLRTLGRHIPLEIHEVPSGTPVFDWTVPDEWNVREAWVASSRGERVIDFRKHNLHLMSYSAPIRTKLSLAELKKHLHSIPERPDWIPYRTSYYRRDWAFCLTHRQLAALPEDTYEVCVDTTLAPGSLTYAECFVPGKTDREILVSTHACHPSLANDNLSGLAVSTFLAKRILSRERRYSYRFLFLPGTIGSITWLARNEARAARIEHGLVVTGVGDAGNLTYKRSRRGQAEIDRAVVHVLESAKKPYAVEDFSPYGYDERQYCSPGFDLPVGCFMRSGWGKYPEYHTSADDLRFVRPESLVSSLERLTEIFDLLESNRRYRNLNPKCEPQLGKRGLYDSTGGRSDAKEFQMAMLWVLNFSDGAHDLLEIAERSRIPFGTIAEAAAALASHGLLAEASSISKAE
jgi:aminopeptidase-like protein